MQRKNPEPYFVHSGDATWLHTIQQGYSDGFLNKQDDPSKVKYVKIFMPRLTYYWDESLLNYLDSCPKVEQLFLIYPTGMFDLDVSEKLRKKFEQLPQLKRLVIEIDSTSILPRYVSDYTSFQYIEVQANYIGEIKPDALASNSLKSVNLQANIDRDIPIDWSFSKNLEFMILDDRGNCQAHDLSPLKHLKILMYRNLTCTKLSNHFFNLPSLEQLHLDTPKLMELNDSIGNLKSLKKFRFNGQIKSLPSAINELKKLELLYLTTPKLTRLNSLGELPNLTNLYIYGSSLDSLPDHLGSFPNLDSLELHLSEKIRSFAFLRNFPSIRHLVLSGINPIQVLDEILALENLESLAFGVCFVTESDVVELARLKKLKLKQLRFVEYEPSAFEECPEKLEIIKEKLNGRLPKKFLK
jgi:Leucine-rich repeat (LRR) protein